MIPETVGGDCVGDYNCPGWKVGGSARWSGGEKACLTLPVRAGTNVSSRPATQSLI